VAVSGVEPVWERTYSKAQASVIESLENRDYGHGVRFRGFAVRTPTVTSFVSPSPLGSSPAETIFIYK